MPRSSDFYSVAVVDFETHRIQPQPFYPPCPVSVAVWLPEADEPVFVAWGHREGNNATYEEALALLRKAWKAPGGVLCHNAKFDLAVAQRWFDLPPPAEVHDTMLLLFLKDPHQPTLSLKPVAEALLGLPAEERDAVKDWLLEHQPVPGIKISTAPQGKHPAGAYTAWAPPSVVGPYAVGDVVRTKRLFDLLLPEIQARGMGPAYDRERRLLTCLMEMEQTGILVDLPRLKADVERYSQVHARMTEWLQQELQAPDLNLDSGDALAEALVRQGLLNLADVGVTPKLGRPKTDLTTIGKALKSPRLAEALRYRGQLGTCLRTFMLNWLEQAELTGGRIYTSWHQTRSDAGGARTGRLSSSPNFQNIAKAFTIDFELLQLDVPPLPKVRSYIIPGPDRVLVGRDFHSQELRVLAHYLGGPLLEAYQQNPRLDMHEWARGEILRLTDLDLTRKMVKNLNFSILYGAGLAKIASQLGLSMTEASTVRDAYLKAVPGLREMYQTLKHRARAKEPMRFWGGREVFCEPAKVVNGRVMEFDYKMVNMLVQGTSADVTKHALVELFKLKKSGWEVLLQVHDELVMSVPAKEAKQALAVMEKAMASPRLDVAMLSDGETGPNWAEMVEAA